MTGSRDDSRSDLPRVIGEAREIVADGRLWLVYERANQYDRRRAHVLVFQHDEMLRFLRQFPPHWRELSDEELYQLTMMR